MWLEHPATGSMVGALHWSFERFQSDYLFGVLCHCGWSGRFLSGEWCSAQLAFNTHSGITTAHVSNSLQNRGHYHKPFLLFKVSIAIGKKQDTSLVCFYVLVVTSAQARPWSRGQPSGLNEWDEPGPNLGRACGRSMQSIHGCALALILVWLVLASIHFHGRNFCTWWLPTEVVNQIVD